MPDTANGGPGAASPAPGPAAPTLRDRHYLIASALISLGYTTRAGRLERLTQMAGRPVAAFAALTRDEEARVLHDLAAELEEQSAADDPAGDRA